MPGRARNWANSWKPAVPLSAGVVALVLMRFTTSLVFSRVLPMTIAPGMVAMNGGPGDVGGLDDVEEEQRVGGEEVGGVFHLGRGRRGERGQQGQSQGMAASHGESS